MNLFEEVIDVIVGVWVIILLLATSPLLVVPYVICQRIKNRRKG